MADTIQIVHLRGDGVGRDIWSASREALEEAVVKAYHGEKRIEWINVTAGIEALEKGGKLLPDATIDTVKAHKVAIKGPLTTPVGSGFRSVNVYLRQIFDLYVCLRPVRYFDGLPSPLKEPKNVDFVIIRENTEDLYKGIEWEEGTDDVRDVIGFLRTKTDATIADDSAIGIKPISRTGTRRFVRWAIEYAIKRQRRAITVVHKGNIMKFTEGAFRKWAYEVAEEYGNDLAVGQSLGFSTPSTSKARPAFAGAPASPLNLASARLPVGGGGGRIAFNDRIADNMFMQVILRPEDYDVLICPNLNGDYLSDACAALIGGLGVAPGANIGDDIAIFEPTHGSAPKYAGKDLVNPTSFLLSGVMMFDYLGMPEAGLLLKGAVEATIRAGVVTYDLARQMNAVKPVSCSTFGAEVTKRIGA